MSNFAQIGVKITADDSSFGQVLGSAKGRAERWSRDVSNSLNSGLGRFLTVGAIAGGLKVVFDAADRLAASNRKLAGEARLAGLSLEGLQAVAGRANAQFGLGTQLANDYATAASKLANKAGDLGKTTQAIESLLNLGAAKGLSASQSLQAIEQAILGIDEGTDKLFGKNPSAIYAEFAKSIGTTVAKLTDQQKAQALLNATIEAGEKTRGEYADWLKTTAGQQAQLAINTQEAAAKIGTAMDGLRTTIIPVLAGLADGLVRFVGGIQLLAVDLGEFAEKAKYHLSQLNPGARAGMSLGVRMGLRSTGLFSGVSLTPGQTTAAGPSLEQIRAGAQLERDRVIAGYTSGFAAANLTGNGNGNGTGNGGPAGAARAAGRDSAAAILNKFMEGIKDISGSTKGRALAPFGAVNFNTDFGGRTYGIRTPFFSPTTKGGAVEAVKAAGDALKHGQAAFAEAAQTAVMGLSDLATVLGGLSAPLRNALQGLNGIAQGVGQAMAARGVRGFAGFAANVGAATAIIGGMSTAIQGLGQALTGTTRQIAEVAASLRNLRLGALGFEVGKGSIAQAIEAVTALLKLNGPQQALGFNQTLGAAGLSQDQLIAIAQAIGFPLLGENGAIQMGRLDEFLEALKLSTQGTNQFADAVNKATGAMQNMPGGYRLLPYRNYQSQDPRMGGGYATSPTGPAGGDPMASGGISITINGATDPEGTARAVVRELRRMAVSQFGTPKRWSEVVA